MPTSVINSLVVLIVRLICHDEKVYEEIIFCKTSRYKSQLHFPSQNNRTYTKLDCEQSLRMVTRTRKSSEASESRGEPGEEALSSSLSANSLSPVLPSLDSTDWRGTARSLTQNLPISNNQPFYQEEIKPVGFFPSFSLQFHFDQITSTKVT